MKKIFLAFLALIVSAPALAQSWGPAGQQPIVYLTGQKGDGSDAQGGIAPAYEDGSAPQEFADIPSTGTMNATTVSSWLSAASTPPQYNNGAPDVGWSESKMRIHCQPSHVSKADPLLAPGNPLGPHMHVFAGNRLADHNSTYTSLRTTGGSTCSGGPLNRSAYWNPAMLEKLASGLTVVKLYDWMIIYYPSFGSISANNRLCRGCNYIFGYDPSEPLLGETEQRAAIAAANATASWTKYTLNSSKDAGAVGWKCLSTGKEVPYFVGPGGVDMWAANDGNASTTDAPCPQSSRIDVNVRAPRCWDGKNRSSPTARKHMVYSVQNNATGNRVCPDGWYWLPDFQQTIHFTMTRPLQYMDWYLSSDRMNAASTPADPSSPSPCRQVGPYYCAGETWHGDWFGAWDYGTKNAPGIMMHWMSDCTGITLYKNTGTKVSTGGADCNDSQISNTQKMLTNGDVSPDPTLSLNPVITFDNSASRPVSQRYVVSPLINQTSKITAHGSHGGGAN